jgi:hypothetical protein
MRQEEAMSDEAIFDPDRTSDARFFRDRARAERLYRRHADTARARRIHAEMAEHYEAVAALLDARAGRMPRSLAAALRGMLSRLRQH